MTCTFAAPVKLNMQTADHMIALIEKAVPAGRLLGQISVPQYAPSVNVSYDPASKLVSTSYVGYNPRLAGETLVGKIRSKWDRWANYYSSSEDAWASVAERELPSNPQEVLERQVKVRQDLKERKRRMQEATSMEIATKPEETKLVPQKKLKHYYKTKKCANEGCNETVIFFPEYTKYVCEKCDKVAGPIDSNNMMDYLTESHKKDVANVDSRSRMNLIFKDPKSHPMYGKPGRNDKCLCGSGKKFKKCCMPEMEKIASEAAVEMSTNGRNKHIESVARGMFEIRFVFDHQRKNGWEEIEQATVGEEIKQAWSKLFPAKENAK